MFNIVSNMSKNKAKNDRILMITAVLLLILSGGAIFWSFNVKNNNSALQVLPPKIIGQAALTIDFGGGEKRAFEGDIVKNETLVDVLIQASKAGNFSYKLDEKSQLAAVENFSKNNKKFWQSYINGQRVEKPFYEVVVKPNDKILMKYVQK